MVLCKDFMTDLSEKPEKKSTQSLPSLDSGSSFCRMTIPELYELLSRDPDALVAYCFEMEKRLAIVNKQLKKERNI